MVSPVYIEVPGSARPAHPDATLLGTAADEIAYVRLIYSRDAERDAQVAHFAKSFTLAADFLVQHGCRLTGTVNALSTAFRVPLFAASLPGGYTFRSRVPSGATSASYSVPAELSFVLAVLGLDTRAAAQPRPIIHPDAASPTALTPVQQDAAYGVTQPAGSALRGTIGSLGGGVSTADLTAATIATGRVTFHGVDGQTNAYTGNPNGADLENILDITEVCQGSAFGCDFVEGPNTDQGMYDVQEAMNALGNAAQSWSWGALLSQWAANAIAAFAALLAEATCPVFVASGDSGPGAGYPDSDGSAISVGATALIPGQSEQVWDDLNSGGGGSSGGFNTSIARPSWQPADGTNAGRGTPDIVLVGAPATGCPLILKGLHIVVGGTSEAAPQAQRHYLTMVASLGKVVHPLAPVLYANAACFNPITGSGLAGEYMAPNQTAPGAGLGSWNVAKLVAALSGGSTNPAPPSQPPTAPPTCPPCRSVADAEFAREDAELAALQAQYPAKGPAQFNANQMVGYLRTGLTTYSKPNLDGVLPA